MFVALDVPAVTSCHTERILKHVAALVAADE